MLLMVVPVVKQNVRILVASLSEARQGSCLLWVGHGQAGGLSIVCDQ